MKPIKKLIIYKFCSLGGVEKCLLDRAALYKNTLPITCYICFLHAEKSMLTIFQSYIAQYNLAQTIQVIAFDDIKKIQFDLISVIDAPQAFDLFEKINVECHTGYAVNRKYLKKLPRSVDKIIVPSEPFAALLARAHGIAPEKLFVLPNFVIKRSPIASSKKIWNKQLIFYFGRLDSLKNYHELFKIFQIIKSQSNNFLFYVLSPSIVELKQMLSLYKPLRDSVILMSGMAFAKITDFLQLMQQHQGIYVSASTGESFGLATAEALAHGIPVVLADNPVHRYLVENNHNYLYPSGKPLEAAEKIMYLAAHYREHLPCEDFLTKTLPRQHLSQMERLIAD